MRGAEDKVVAWVGHEVIPHEADVRAWLRRRVQSQEMVDDVVQEAYCRLANLKSVDQIASGRAYFFRTAANIVIDKVRRSRIVRIEALTDLNTMDIVADEPSPERALIARDEFGRVWTIIRGLPERCRRVVELRRIQGLSQREVAKRLGISESAVEFHSVRALKLILAAVAEGADGATPERAKQNEPARNRKRPR